MFLQPAFIRDHYWLRRHRIELHNSGDNDYHDQQRIHCANPDSYAHPDSYANPDAYTRTTANSNANSGTNANTRYSDDYVGR